MVSKTKVNLRNDSGSPIVFGTLTINPAASVVIWNTDNSESVAKENFEQVRDNITAFNQNIPTGDLVYIIGGVDQIPSFAFQHFGRLVEAYPLIYTQTELQLEGLTSNTPINDQHGGIIFHGSDTYKRLGPGEPGEFLVSQGPGSDVEWVDIDLDGYAKADEVPEAPSCIGQIPYSVDGYAYQPAMPITTTAGWLVNDQGLLLVEIDEES